MYVVFLGVMCGSIVIALMMLFDDDLPLAGRIALVAWVGVSLLLQWVPTLRAHVSFLVPLFMQLPVLGWYALRQQMG